MLFFVFLLPALAHARISIGIDLSSRGNDVKFNLKGQDSHVITVAEAEQLGVKFRFGSGLFNSMLTKVQPCPGTPLTRILKPIEATVLSFSKKSTVLVSSTYKNGGNTTVQHRVDLKQSVTNTVTSSWQQTHAVQAGMEISAEFNLRVSKVTGKTSLSYNHQWGKSGSKSETLTVGSSTGLTISVPPGLTSAATLLASQGTAEIKVVYESSIRGICREIEKTKGIVGDRVMIHPDFMAPEVIEIIKVEFYCDIEAVSHLTPNNNTMVE